MKRLALIVVGVAALASFRVTAQSPAQHSAPTFAKDVAPIMYGKCANCHRPGEVAPMSLLSYEDARPWAKAIKAKVVAREGMFRSSTQETTGDSPQSTRRSQRNSL